MINLRPTVATFPDRFQPIHNEHIERIKFLSKKYNRVYVCILNSKQNKRNPFSLTDRISMIEKITSNFPNVKVSINDWQGDIWTENPMLINFFKNLGYKVYTFPEGTISSTDIRNKKKGWEKLIPKEVKEWL